MAGLLDIDNVFTVIDEVGKVGDIRLDLIKKKYEPAADYGFFGPGSVTWKARGAQ